MYYGNDELREYFNDRPILAGVVFGLLALVYGAVCVYGLMQGKPVFLWSGLILFLIHAGASVHRFVVAARQK